MQRYVISKVVWPMLGQRLGEILITANERQEPERTKEINYLRDVIRRCGTQSDSFRCEVVVLRSVADGIVSLGAQEEFDLIAMHTHDREGLARLIKGSVAARVERESPTEVRVFRPRELAEVEA